VAWLLVTKRRNRRGSKDLQNQRRRPRYGLQAPSHARSNSGSLKCQGSRSPAESRHLNSYVAELQLNDSAPEGDGGRLRAIPHVQLFENVLDMVLGGLFRDLQIVSDLLIT